MNKSTVLFFDSGMGGLSVYSEAKKLMPDNHYLYCFDNAGFPYSEKSEETIIQRTLDICKKLIRIIHLMPLLLLVILRVLWCYRLYVNNFLFLLWAPCQLLSQQQKSHKRNILVYWQQRVRLNALMLMILFISLPPIV